MTIRTAISNIFYSIGDWAFTWGEMLDDRADEDHFGIDEPYYAWDEAPDLTDEQWEKAAQYAAEGRCPADIHFTEHELGRLEDDGGPARPADEPEGQRVYRSTVAPFYEYTPE